MRFIRWYIHFLRTDYKRMMWNEPIKDPWFWGIFVTLLVVYGLLKG